MNASNAKDYLPLVQALAEGKEIQFACILGGGWMRIEDPGFDNPAERYRIKPEPLELWVNIYPDGNSGRAYNSKYDAECSAGVGARQVRLREVIE